MKRSFFRVALLLALALVVLVLAVPPSTLAFLRTEYEWLGRFVKAVHRIWPAVDMEHVVAFAVLGFVGHYAFPKLPMPAGSCLLLALAVVTEAMQFWVPGRSGRLSDIVVDVVGGLAGLSLAWLLRATTRPERRIAKL